ncbi:unnamed protein product [Prunus brigantina]
MRDDMEDPETYMKAMLDIDSKKWQEAMKSEMDSMYANQVWTLVDPPDAMIKSIRILLVITTYYDYKYGKWM